MVRDASQRANLCSCIYPTGAAMLLTMRSEEAFSYPGRRPVATRLSSSRKRVFRSNDENFGLRVDPAYEPILVRKLSLPILELHHVGIDRALQVDFGPL